MASPAPGTARDPRRAPLDGRALLAAILPEGTCVTCLEPEVSPLHYELCEAGDG